MSVKIVGGCCMDIYSCFTKPIQMIKLPKGTICTEFGTIFIPMYEMPYSSSGKLRYMVLPLNFANMLLMTYCIHYKKVVIHPDIMIFNDEVSSISDDELFHFDWCRLIQTSPTYADKLRSNSISNKYLKLDIQCYVLTEDRSFNLQTPVWGEDFIKILKYQIRTAKCSTSVYKFIKYIESEINTDTTINRNRFYVSNHAISISQIVEPYESRTPNANGYYKLGHGIYLSPFRHLLINSFDEYIKYKISSEQKAPVGNSIIALLTSRFVWLSNYELNYLIINNLIQVNFMDSSIQIIIDPKKQINATNAGLDLYN